MTEADPQFWTTLIDVVAGACLIAGAALAFTAGVGILRFPNLLARMHAVTKPQVLGLVLLCLGVALRVRSFAATTMLALVIGFQLLTSPVAAHLIGRAGVRTNKVPASELEVNDLAVGEAWED